MVQDVKPGGIFLINCQWDFEELNKHLHADAKRYIAKNNVQLYTINAIDLAVKVGMGKRTNTILQAAFFALANVLPKLTLSISKAPKRPSRWSATSWSPWAA